MAGVPRGRLLSHAASESCLLLHSCRPGVLTAPRTLSSRSGQDHGHPHGARTLFLFLDFLLPVLCGWLFVELCRLFFACRPGVLTAPRTLSSLSGQDSGYLLATCLLAFYLAACLFVRFWLLPGAVCRMCTMCRVPHAWDASGWTGVFGIPVRRAWGWVIECRRGTELLVPRHSAAREKKKALLVFFSATVVPRTTSAAVTVSTKQLDWFCTVLWRVIASCMTPHRVLLCVSFKPFPACYQNWNVQTPFHATPSHDCDTNSRSRTEHPNNNGTESRLLGVC